MRAIIHANPPVVCIVPERGNCIHHEGRRRNSGLRRDEGEHRPCGFAAEDYLQDVSTYGGVLVSTYCLSHRWHVEDDSLASLKPRIKKINADYEDLALAA